MSGRTLLQQSPAARLGDAGAHDRSCAAPLSAPTPRSGMPYHGARCMLQPTAASISKGHAHTRERVSRVRVCI
jgi:hypothetical protein